MAPRRSHHNHAPPAPPAPQAATPYPLLHLLYAKPPPRVYPAPEERIQGWYYLPEKYYSDNPRIQELNLKLPELYDRTRDLRSDVIIRIAHEVMARDAMSFRKVTKVMALVVEGYKQGAELRRQIQDMGGVPMPEPVAFKAQLLPPGF